MNPTIEHDRITDTVDLLTHLAASPMGDQTTNHAERVALLTLEVAYRSGQPLSMSGLADRIRLSRAAMTSMTDRLTRRGFVTRTDDLIDRRRTWLELTPTGRDLVAQSMPEVAVAS